MSITLYKPHLIEFESTETLYRHAFDYVEDKIVSAQAEKGIARLLLTGGDTPLPLYEKLGESSIIEWDSIELYQSDERYVATNDVNSNQMKITQALGSQTLEQCKEVHFFNPSLSLEESIVDYDERLDALDEVFFDVAVLGVGSDGHIASLFPNGNYLKHLDSHTVATTAPNQFAVQQRMSLTIESLLSTEEIVIIMTGEKKLNVLSELLEGNLSATEFPAKFLLSHPNLRLLFCWQ